MIINVNPLVEQARQPQLLIINLWYFYDGHDDNNNNTVI